MHRHLNTLFITLEGAYLGKDGAAVEVRHQGCTKLRVPLHNLEGVVCLGWEITASAALMAACAEANVALSFHNPHGKFLAATHGYTSGNILLRRQQYRIADREKDTLAIARRIVSAKIANCRTVLQRAQREHAHPTATLGQTINHLKTMVLACENSGTLATLRGIEGEAASAYFSQLPCLISTPDPAIQMNGRSKRPPLDPVNALLSFLYALLAHDCRSALESCGLDPQCGFLHQDRPGRPSLALDLMEEFRAPLADRTALTLLNRRQLTGQDFERQETGAFLLRDDARKRILAAWQERKQETIIHPFLEEKSTIGFLPHLQARLLARHIRGDLDTYPSFLWK